MLATWFLPGALLMAPDQADPRRPADQVTWHSAGVDAGLGSELALIGQDGERLRWRMGLLGGAWMGFSPGGSLTFHLMSLDGRFGLPLDLQRGPWGLRLMWAHDSAHRGDGVRADPEAWPEDGGWKPHSREWVEGRVSWRGSGATAQLGIRQITHSVDEGGGLQLVGGLTVQGQGPGPYAAGHVHASAEHGWEPAMSGELGLSWGETTLLRVALVGQTGPDAAGQLAGSPDDWIGLRLELSP